MKTAECVVYVGSGCATRRLVRKIRRWREPALAVVERLADGEKLQEKIPSLEICSVLDYEDREVTHARSAEEAARLIRAWRDLPLGDGRRFGNLTMLRGLDLWEFHSGETLLYFLTERLYAIKLAQKILEREEPRRVIVVGREQDHLAPALAQVALQAGRQIQRVGGLRRLRPGDLVSSVWRVHSPLGGILRRGVELLSLAYNAPAALQGWLRDWGMRSGENPGGVLFFTTNAKTLDSILPLIRHYQARGEGPLVVDWFGRRSDSSAALEKAGIPYRIFAGYLSFKDLRVLRRVSGELGRNWQTVRSSTAFRHALRYGEVELWPLLEEFMARLFGYRFPQILGYYLAAKRLYEQERPGIVVVVIEREYVAKACLQAAKEAGIPTLALQRGAIADFPDQDPPLYVDRLAVEGAHAKRVLVQRGHDADRIEVTGNPRYDEFHHPEPDSVRAGVCRGLGIAPQRRIALFTSSFRGVNNKEADRERIVRLLFRTTAEDSELEMIVKLHPAERDLAWYQNYIPEGTGGRIHLVRDWPLRDLIAACDLFMTTNSTTGMEAILLDRPFLYLRLSRWEPELLPYASTGAAVEVREEEAFLPTLRQVMEDTELQASLAEGRRRFLAEHVDLPDGGATSQVLRLIERQRHSHKTSSRSLVKAST